MLLKYTGLLNVYTVLEGEVIVNLENGDNLSWIVKHPYLENVFYATHEVEVGAVSRWKIDEEGKVIYHKY